MRLILAITCGCILGLAVGCGMESSDKVEMPDNPAPLPKSLPVSSPVSGDIKSDADQKQLPLSPPG